MVEVGVVPVSPQKHVILCTFSLTEPYSNYVAEYYALLIGMKVVRKVGAKNLEAYGASMLIFNQLHGKYEVCHKNLIPCYKAVSKMSKEFKNFYIEYLPRQQNAYANALTSLVSFLVLSAGASEKILVFTHNLYYPRPLIGRD